MKMTLATCFGIAGLIANTVWPLITIRRYLLTGQIIACGLMFTHFYLLGANTGAMVMLVAGSQALLALPLEKYPKFTYVYISSMLITPWLCWYSWSGYPSLLSSAALTIYCVANLHTQVRSIKSYLALCILCWFGHNYMVHSIPGMISNVLALSTLSYSLLTLYANRDAATQSSSLADP